MRRTLLFFIFLFCVAATPVLGQEVFVRFGESRKQAVAIGLSEARKKGAKVPPPPKE
jgi:hypothetical protein